MKVNLFTFMLFSAIIAVTYAYSLPDSIRKDNKERVPSTPDEIPPYDDKPHPETRPSKPFPTEQPPYDPQPYPETRPSSKFQGEPPSFEPQSYPGSGLELDPEHLRFRRSPKDAKNEITVNDNQKKDAGIVENNYRPIRNKGKPQFGACGSYPWD
ncbi:B1-hordein-like [Belonocnema kinseyi]|uniref:B1-hordein-like n=1 Tax=Belonocnema kinseyi TaxID=2817044 RepID=UPI00143D7929|nr:B1-hordein-like [Belonocnema kinseyi]